jgi:iron complex transport system substrate-binding protein
MIIGLISACSQSETKKQQDFIQLGVFNVHHISPKRTEVRDGAGRTLVLIPRDTQAPKDIAPHRIIRTPVKRVAAYGSFNVSALKALGVIGQVLVGVTDPLEYWHIQEVRQGLATGKIAYLGDTSNIDFERLKQQRPELVLTWDPAIIPMLNDLGIPCMITSSSTAMCLNTRIRFVKFLAPFFNKEKEAQAFIHRVNQTLTTIREQTSDASPPPKVMWGDIYEKRVLVEPGNAWVAELINILQSDYLFDDVFGTS